MNISGLEWVLILVAALLLFGPKKLPELGRSIGKGIREFKKATSGMLEDEKKSEVSNASHPPSPGNSAISTQAQQTQK